MGKNLLYSQTQLQVKTYDGLHTHCGREKDTHVHIYATGKETGGWEYSSTGRVSPQHV